MKEKEAFEEVKQSINEALQEIKKICPDLYEYLEKNILMDEKTCTFVYLPPKV
jgi:hypothetical protein